MAGQLSNDAPAPNHKLNETMFNQRVAQTSAQHLLPYIEPYHHILDLGCGPGSITAGLAELVPDGHVIGIDSNADSIRAAISLAEARGIQNLSFRTGDIKKDLVDIDSESFDIVHTHQVLLHLAEPLETMREMRRILKTGGILSTVDSAMHVVIPSLPGVIDSEKAYERFSRAKGADPNFGQRHHIVAHEAGFAWEQMEISSRAMKELSDQDKAFLLEAAIPAADTFVKTGTISGAEAEEQKRAFREWSKLPESRWIELASALLCWKR